MQTWQPELGPPDQHEKPDAMACTYDPSIPNLRWEAETRESA